MNKNWRRKWLLQSLLRASPYKILRFPGVEFNSEDDSYHKYMKNGLHSSVGPESEQCSVKGIIGCWIAHSQVLEQISEQNGVTVILEDDFVCNPTFFENALRMVNGFDRDFDIIIFDTRGDGPLAMHKIAENIYHPRYYSFPYYVGTQCIFVNNARIPKILEAKLNAQVEYIDGFLFTTHTLDTYIFYTGECGTRGLGSDLNPSYKAKFNLPDMLMAFLPHAWRGKTIGSKINFSKFEEKKYVQLSEEKLKLLEGFFESHDYKDNCIRFRIEEGRLVLTQLWDNKHFSLLPLSEVEFFCEEMPVRMNFIKDKSGEVTQFEMFGHYVFQKNQDYKQIIRERTTLTYPQLKILEGKYQHTKDFVTQITAMEDHLLVKQLWDNNEFSFVPESELRFFVKDNPSFHIRFISGADGAINQVIAVENIILDKIDTTE